ncbi:MAG TPA: hypothetical protein VM638_01620, partial [Actinomycetota bacterium]|nr:hypothetical protein [Actinomycetota bacterium]
RPVLELHGFGDLVTPLRDAYRAGDLVKLAEIAMPMVDTYAIAGDEDACREGLARFDGLLDRVILGSAWVGPPEAVVENHRRLLHTFRPAG